MLSEKIQKLVVEEQFGEAQRCKDQKISFEVESKVLTSSLTEARQKLFMSQIFPAADSIVKLSKGKLWAREKVTNLLLENEHKSEMTLSMIGHLIRKVAERGEKYLAIRATDTTLDLWCYEEVFRLSEIENIRKLVDAKPKQVTDYLFIKNFFF